MDDLQKNSLNAFDEMLKSIDKNELNNLIDEISNLDCVGEPTIDEYFNLIKEQFAQFYFCDEMVGENAEGTFEHFQTFRNILNKSYNEIVEKETFFESFNMSLNLNNVDGFFDTNSESEKTMKGTILAA